MSEAVKQRLATVSEASLVELPAFAAENGLLSVMQGGTMAVPISIARAFAIRAPQGAGRGGHAHKRCTQVMVCLGGHVEVTLDDGQGRRTEILDADRPQALTVPPGIWGEQLYLDADAVLLVLCDRPYEADDYIRDDAEFLIWRADAAV